MLLFMSLVIFLFKFVLSRDSVDVRAVFRMRNIEVLMREEIPAGKTDLA